MRSPLFYPMNRGGDADAGGAADLQTDVMRFMAILSLCLVAIFALVQSIPLVPETQSLPQALDNSVEVVPATGSTGIPQPVPPGKVTLVRPVPQPAAVEQKRLALQRPDVQLDRSEETVPLKVVVESTVAAPLAATPGFTLQFATDDALLRLVARQVVGLYAIAPDATTRMTFADGRISFWPASLPGQFHEMEETTVPADILATYSKNHSQRNTRWGVTLPANMSRELNDYLATAEGGSLVIAASGRIELRR
jgi:hypothetical protein